MELSCIIYLRMNINYRKILIESRIEKIMGFSGGVVIEGAKWKCLIKRFV
ncbi:MAG: hypothetical protein BWX56_01549 [Euryarchaeota archaeon ADurb.Bin023]|nr:MAG: hypothetical protein BWX56_01549 [Euryarchaeota archaeon ADurb.Bin023]